MALAPGLPLVLSLFILTVSTSYSTQLSTWHHNALNSSLTPTQATRDPCTELYNRLLSYKNSNPQERVLVVRPSDVSSCALTVPFNKERELGNLQSIILYFQNFYGLLEFAKKSPAPNTLPSNYNLIAALRGLASQRWTRAEPFYSAIVGAINRLNDGHTKLNPVCPPFDFALPLPMVHTLEGGRQVIRVGPREMMSRFLTTQLAALPPFNFDVSRFYGAKVMTINGQNSVKYMRVWATRSAGGFHDPAQRYNQAFAAPTWTTSGRQSFTPGVFSFRNSNPVFNYVDLGLIRQGSSRQERVRVPWLALTSALNLPGFTDKDTYFRQFCAASVSSRESVNGETSGQFFWKRSVKPLKLLHRPPPSISPSDGADDPPGTGKKIEPSNSEPVMRMIPEIPEWFYSVGVNESLQTGVKNVNSDGPRLQDSMAYATDVSGPEYFYPVYKLKDGKTGVVVIHTFAIEESPVGGNPVIFLLNEAIKSFSLANKVATQVIIDVTRNPGGFTSLGWFMISLLMGTRNYPNPRSRMQDFARFLVQTPLIRPLRDNNVGFYSWKGSANVNEVPYVPATSNQFLFPASVRRFGSVPGRYSRPFKLAVKSLSELARREFPPALGNKKFLLFSDGTCFSTCNNFAFFLQRKFKKKLVTIGGYPDRRLGFAGGGGGFIMPSAQRFLEEIPPKLRQRPVCPKPFTVRMAFGMRWAWGGLREDSSPIEFNYLAGDHRISYSMSNIVDRSLQYKEVAKFL